MAVFRILCLSGGILKEWEELQAETLVEALDARTLGRGCERVEVWCEGQRVAVLRSARSEATAL